jgi:tetratricopeptide (TPR) repeat protein
MGIEVKKMNLHNNEKSKSIMFVLIGVVIAVLVGYKIIVYREAQVVKKGTLAGTYFYNGEYDKAVEKYLQVSKRDKLSPIWEAKIAEVYSVKGDVDNSNTYIEKVKKFEEINAETMNYVIFTEYMNDNPEQALKDGEEALKKYPDDKQIKKTMFIIYMTNKMLDKAKAVIESYSVDETSAYDTAEYARMLMVIGERKKGFEVLKEAWNIDKDEYKIYDVLAQVADYNKDLLLEDIAKLCEQYPNDDVYKMWLAKIYSLSPDTADLAEKQLKEIEGKEVGDIEIELIKAAVLQFNGEESEADKLINNIIDANVDDYRVYHTASWHYLNKGDLDKAQEYCQKSIEQNKEYPDNYGFLMPEILKYKDEKKNAEAYFRTAMRIEPYNYNIMLKIADYWYTLGNYEEALNYYELIEILKPHDPNIKYNMAFIYINAGKVDEAIDLLKECIELSKDNPTPQYNRTLGTIYMLQDNPENAIKEIRFAYHADEEDILTLNNAGSYYITMEGNIDRGYYNLLKAFEGLNDSYDQFIVDTITANYEKADELMHKYYNGDDNEKIEIPDFELFY